MLLSARFVKKVVAALDEDAAIQDANVDSGPQG